MARQKQNKAKHVSNARIEAFLSQVFQKQEAEQVCFQKEAKTVTMCAWGAGLAVGAIASNAIKIAITEIKPSQTQI